MKGATYQAYPIKADGFVSTRAPVKGATESL